MNYIRYGILILFVWMLSGCATLLGEEPQSQAQTNENRSLRYSDAPQMAAPVDRQYRRMTKSKMEDESDLQANAGSMWVMEGQTSYLFAQNKSRKEGDVMNVKLDNVAQKQVETKIQVIKKLVKQLEDEQRSQLANILAGNTEEEENRSPASTTANATAGAANGAGAAAPKAENKEPEKDDLSQIQTVPTRIVERMADGNYRVKGAQPFMIGKREYKVLVTGILRAEDFNDEGVQSSKLLDPQYDVVSLRRKDKNDRTGLF